VIDRVEGAEFVRDAVRIAEGVPEHWNGRSRKYRQRADRDIGRRLPAHSTALGKVLLAYLSPQQVRTILEERGLPRQNAATITSQSRLLRELEAVRKQGYATSDGEQTAGIRAIAAPVYGPEKMVGSGVSLNGNIPDAVWANPIELVDLVKEASREISRRLPFY
jgi:DNA-binding IclR family transcriptional regulator